MGAILLVFLAACFSVGIVESSESGALQSNDKESFEEKVKNGYDLLKNERNADTTMRLLEQLQKMEAQIKDEFSLTPKQNADLLKKTKKYIGFKRDHVQPMGDSIVEINEKSKVGAALYQGDVILTKEQAQDIMEGIKVNRGSRTKRQAFRGKSYPKNLWSDGVYYSFSPNSTAARRVFKKGAEAWKSVSCIDFVERSTAKDRIVLIKAKGCWSSAGKVGGVQDLSLGDGCETVGIAAHEIGHALGFFHTHSRHDRDNFITVYTQNIVNSVLGDYKKQTESTNYNYNLTYDYGSVMHYGAKIYSENNANVLVTKDVKHMQTIGSLMISFYDKLMINMHYSCLQKCIPRTSAVCKNGGFPHPRDCSKCICPSGYGGRLCNERPPGCGKTLTATTSFQNLTDIVSGKEPNITNDEFTMCNYWIQAPAGSTIEVVLDRYDEGSVEDGCIYTGVEIKTAQDKRLTGYRFCGPAYLGTSLISTHNVVPIITYSNVFRAITVLRYRIASSGGGPRPT